MEKSAFTFLLCGLYVAHAQALVCKLQGGSSRDLNGVWPGANVTLNCSVLKNGPAERMMWKKNGNILGKEWRIAGKRTILAPLSGASPNSFLWQAIEMKNVSYQDEGHYTCKAFKQAESAEHSFWLRIYAKPKIIEPVRFRVRLIEGSSAVIVCKAKGWPLPWVQWQKEDTTKNILVSAIDKTSVAYTISSAKRQDEGKYGCQANNTIGNAYQPFWVTFSPAQNKRRLRIRAHDSSVSVYPGDNLTLTCTAHGVEVTYAVYWQKNSERKQLNYFERKQYEDKVDFTLKIVNVSRRDAANYTCGVTTSYGSAKTAIQLDVKIRVALHSPAQPVTSRTSLAPGRHSSFLWQATVPAVLVCVTACITGFIIGLLARGRKRKRRRDLWDISEIDVGDSSSYLYDVFITYSTKDFIWVKTELIPVLEKHSFNYCIHNRDFEPGRSIVDNIADSIYGSRHIVAVLSKNYLASSFCRGELNMALCRSTLLSDSAIIAIRIDDIEISKLPKGLRNLTLLDYYKQREQEHWENRLVKQLKVTNGEITFKENVPKRKDIDLTIAESQSRSEHHIQFFNLAR